MVYQDARDPGITPCEYPEPGQQLKYASVEKYKGLFGCLTEKKLAAEMNYCGLANNYSFGKANNYSFEEGGFVRTPDK